MIQRASVRGVTDRDGSDAVTVPRRRRDARLARPTGGRGGTARIAGLASLVAVAWLAAACKQEPEITAACSRSELAADCVFSNAGAAGKSCVVAVITSTVSAARVESTVICSGELAPNTSSSPVRGIFVDARAVRDACGASGNDCRVQTEPLR